MPMEMADEWIHRRTVAANPIGWPFDPDELLARYEDGAPLIELMTTGRDRYSQDLIGAD
jgi:hypothetical protein